MITRMFGFLSSAAPGETAEPRTSSSAKASRTILRTQLMNSLPFSSSSVDRFLEQTSGPQPETHAQMMELSLVTVPVELLPRSSLCTKTGCGPGAKECRRPAPERLEGLRAQACQRD